MQEWRAKRFWDEVSVGAGFQVLLDGRVLKTPQKAQLELPTKALAEAVADEWRSVGEFVEPESMPVTRAANSAIDKVKSQRQNVTSLLLGYAETDLIAYRAEGPDALVQRQAEAWDPWIGWVETRFGQRMALAEGVIPRPQPEGLQTAFAAHLGGFSHFWLTGFHDLVTLSGSFVLALAVSERALSPEAGWDISTLDETWQETQWGIDAEAAEARAAKREVFLAAATFLNLLEGNGS